VVNWFGYRFGPEKGESIVRWWRKAAGPFRTGSRAARVEEMLGFGQRCAFCQGESPALSQWGGPFFFVNG